MNTVRCAIVLLLGALVSACGQDQNVSASGSADTPSLPAAPWSGDWPTVGDPAPDFRLPTSSGGEFHLADEAAARPHILVFYPGGLRVSYNILRELEQRRSDLEADGVRLIAIATQSVAEAEAAANDTGVGFAILADTDGAVGRLYGVPVLVPGKPKSAWVPLMEFGVDRQGEIEVAGPARIPLLP
jgi:peroxiredoxin